MRWITPFTVMLAFTVIQSEAEGASTEVTRPNIVVIMADDLGYGSLGCYGSKEIKTPNIDRLAATGLRLTDFHSNGSVCSPTRAALMTGRYPQRCIWVEDGELSPVFQKQRKENLRQRWAWGISPNELTIAKLVGQSGYRTGIIGKWHLGYDEKFHPMNFGFDEFRGFVGGNVDYHTHVAGYGLKQLDWWKGRKIENEGGYTTDLLTRYATDFISRNKDKPFFLYLPHAAAHDPWQGRDPGRKKSPVETYREMIEVLDQSVGKVGDVLKEQGLEKTTLLIFCSDNGAASPAKLNATGPLKGRKGSMNEGGHRVPFIAAWPGVIAPGTTSSSTVMTMDLFPTISRLAGAVIPAERAIDGIDLLPLLKGGALVGERDLHWLFGDSWAVRKGPWKLIGEGGKALSLVNLDDDLGEAENHLGDHPVLADQLMKLHSKWIGEVGNR
jgi:arylsulfatase A